MDKPQLTQKQMEILVVELNNAIADAERNNALLPPCDLLNARKTIINNTRAHLRDAMLADSLAERQGHIVKAIDTLEALKC